MKIYISTVLDVVLDVLDLIQFNSNLFHSEVKLKLQKLTSNEKYSQLFPHQNLKNVNL